MSNSSQTATADGDGNIVVQVGGSNNAVTISRDPDLQLTLPAGVDFADNPEHQHLLDPASEFIDYVGQEDVLSRVNAWLDSDKLFSVLVITGRGGAGKTRLALKLCRERDKAEGEDCWAAGFISRTEFTDRMTKHMNFAVRGWKQDTLMVFDYAMAFERLGEFLKELSQNPRLSAKKSSKSPEPGKRLRVLLLEREASLESGWLAAALPGGHGSGAVLGLFAAEKIIDLPPLQTAQERREVMARTLVNLKSTVTLPAPGSDPEYENWLGGLNWAGDPLYLMMAAMYAHEHGLGKILSLNRVDLAEYIAANELERVKRLANHNDDQKSLFSHLVAFATLCGGLDAEALGEVVKQELAALECEGCATPAHIRRQLVKALPGPDEGVRPIQPDLIGEAVILKALGEGKGKAAEKAVLRAFGRRPWEVLQALVRMVQDFVEVDDRAVEWLENVAVRPELTLQERMLLLDAMPQSTLRLRNLAAEQYGRIVEIHRNEFNRDRSESNSSLLATGLSNLGNRLGALGRREEAVEAAREAVEIRRELVALNRDANLADLALSLNNLGNRLCEVGRHEEALVAAQEAVDIRRALATLNRDAILPDLASSLNNLGLILSALGRREEALAAIRKAVEHYRQLEAANPEDFLPNLATSLYNLGNSLSALGHHGGALEAIREAVKYYRELYALNRDAFLPNLAHSLNNLGARLSALGRREEALEAAWEAVGHGRELAALARDAFLPDLASSLNNLGTMLSGLDHHEEALEAALEAVEQYRELTSLNCNAFLPDLASGLNNLGLRLSDLGRRAEALKAAREAVDIRRDLAKVRPAAFLPDLAMSLCNMSTMLSALGRREEALEAAQEAVEHDRELAALARDAFLPGLADSLNNLGLSLSALGQREEALQASREAADIRRELAKANPDAFLPDLANSLGMLGFVSAEADNHEDAIAAFTEAAGYFLELAQHLPQVFGEKWVRTLVFLVQAAQAADRQDVIQATLQELRGRLTDEDYQALLHQLA